MYVLNVRFHYSKDGGEVLRDHRHAPRRQSRPVDRSRRSIAHDRGERRRRERVLRPRRNLVDAEQSADRADVSRVDGQRPSRIACSAASRTTAAVRIRSRSAAAMPSVRATGSRPQVVRADTSSAKPDDPDIVVGGSYGGFLRVIDHRTGIQRSIDVWPDNPMGWAAADLKPSVPVELSHRIFAARSRRALRGRRARVSQRRSGPELDSDQRRSDPRRQDAHGLVRRSNHQGQHERVLRHGVRARGVAA